MSGLEPLYKSFKTETNKFLDIANVYQKLQDNGSIKVIFDLFQQIFLNEKKFTLEEIHKIIQMNTSKQINIENQLKLNGAIFKTNFLAIADIIIEKAFNETYNNPEVTMTPAPRNSLPDPNSAKLREKKNSPAPNIKPQNAQNSNSPHYMLPKSQRSPEAVHRSNNNNNNLQNNNSSHKQLIPQSNSAKILSTSVVVTKKDERANRKNRKNQHFNGNRTNNSFFSQLSPNKANLSSNNSFYSSSSQYHGFDSEFSYIARNTYSFSRDEKMKSSKENSPGPIYHPEKGENLTKKKGPVIKFDKAEKTSWFDDKHKFGMESPGFVYNPSKHFTSK